MTRIKQIIADFFINNIRDNLPNPCHPRSHHVVKLLKITCFRNKENINTMMVAFDETKIR